MPDVELRARAARQLALLNREKVALEVARSVCRLDGPLASMEKLKQDGATELLSALAEIDAQAVVDLLEFVLGPLSLEELRELDHDVCPDLVWALVKIAFRTDTFEQGARLLLKLAGAGNEHWGNNGTRQFKALFSVLGGNTEAGPEARLQVLDEALASGDDRLLPIVIDALLP
jgi:hypothetical protein